VVVYDHQSIKCTLMLNNQKQRTIPSNHSGTPRGVDITEYCYTRTEHAGGVNAMLEEYIVCSRRWWVVLAVAVGQAKT